MLSGLLGEVIAFLPQAIKLGMDVTAIVERSIALANMPTPATADELAAFKVQLDDEKARLASLTAELNQDQ